MARTLRNPTLDKRDARLRLKSGAKHWGALGELGLHIGYRRGPRSGTWYARRMAEGRYILTTLGATDDATDADGRTVLNYHQAVAKARLWWQSEGRKALGLDEHKAGPYTVGDACEDYLKYFVAKGGKSEYATRRVIEVHIRPALGLKDTAKLTSRHIRDWHHALALAPKMLRTKRAARTRSAKPVDATDGDAMRSRRASANRILTVLKAVLNHAWHERRLPSDEAWRPVEPFKKVDAPVVRYLSRDECHLLVNTCPTDLRTLVRGALLTGARYGELCRLRVADVNLDSGTLAIRHAKGGKPRHIILTDEGRELFTELTAGRKSDANVFLREDGRGWGPAQQTRPIRDACDRAAIAPAIGFHALRHTHATALAMAGVPMGVIAKQLGHADSRITERHYAHLAPSYVADTIRASFPKLGLSGGKSVSALRRT